MGIGTYINSDDGSVYVGEFANLKKHGHGTEKFNGGKSIYTGQWANDAWCGEGVYSGEDGNFTGTFANGESTFGTLVSKSGTGKLIYKNGDICEGMFRDGQVHGYAEVMEQGSLYKGDWVNGTKHGHGEFTPADKSYVYTGDFLGDFFHGSGRMVHANGMQYVGSFEKDKKCGYGVLFYKGDDGPLSVFERYPGDAAYHGMWLDGKRHGKGTLTFYGTVKPRLEKTLWSCIVKGEWRLNRLLANCMVEVEEHYTFKCQTAYMQCLDLEAFVQNFQSKFYQVGRQVVSWYRRFKFRQLQIRRSTSAPKIQSVFRMHLTFKIFTSQLQTKRGSWLRFTRTWGAVISQLQSRPRLAAPSWAALQQEHSMVVGRTGEDVISQLMDQTSTEEDEEESDGEGGKYEATASSEQMAGLSVTDVSICEPATQGDNSLLQVEFSSLTLHWLKHSDTTSREIKHDQVNRWMKHIDKAHSRLAMQPRILSSSVLDLTECDTLLDPVGNCPLKTYSAHSSEVSLLIGG
eukprot:gene27450-34168_t